MRIIFAFVFYGIVNLNMSAQTAVLTVKIFNVQPLTGKIMVALFNSKETYFDIDQMYAGFEIPADSTVVSCSFPDLPEGIYAITIYHDEDSNGEMNRNWLGMPTEGYAFSNNFTSSIRPASYNDAAFKLANDTTILLRMNY